jgi:hypothetical protein
MNRHSFVVLAVAAALALAPGMAAPQLLSHDLQVLEGYQHSLDAYTVVHREVERWLPPLDVTHDTDTIQGAIDRMGTGMQLARADAKAGDVFTPDVARLFRLRLNAAAVQHGDHLGALFGEMRDSIPAAYQAPTVNERFPWNVGAVMPACLVPALPPAPDELQYRFIGNDLFLVDTHSGLVVDVLPNALGGT